MAGQQILKRELRSRLEYTILVGGKTTTTVVTDEAGMRIGDCVALEQGAYVNLRLVDDRQCAAGTKAPLT